MRFDIGTLDSGERSLPFGLLVFIKWEIKRPHNQGKADFVILALCGKNFIFKLCLETA